MLRRFENYLVSLPEPRFLAFAWILASLMVSLSCGTMACIFYLIEKHGSVYMALISAILGGITLLYITYFMGIVTSYMRRKP